MLPERSFTRVLRHDGQRVLIHSTCRTCGASNLGSAQDGSIQDWEDGHACEKKKAPKKEPLSALVAAGRRALRRE